MCGKNINNNNNCVLYTTVLNVDQLIYDYGIKIIQIVIVVICELELELATPIKRTIIN